MNYYAVLTDHGAQLIEQAYQHGQVVTITQMAIGDGGGVELEPATSALAVAGEFDRVPLTSGASASSMLGGGVDYESTTHVGKWIRTLGLMDAQGNLIVYSNYPPTYIADKGSTLFRTLGLNIQLPIVHGDAVTVIVERPPYPPATETEYGVVKLATQAQTDAGAADDVVVTPKKLKAWVKQATETVLGMLKVATQAQTDAGTADDVVVTPKKNKAGFSVRLSASGYIVLPSWLSGLIIQWGNAITTPISGTTTRSFPIAFPHSCLCGVASYDSPGVAGNTPLPSIGFFAVSSSTFIVASSPYGGAQPNANWLAIGY